MWYLALLTPLVLLLLMLVLGRCERWLDESTPPPPARPEPRRWRRTPRGTRSDAGVAASAGRRLLARRARAAARRRVPVPAPRAAATAPTTGRRHLLGGRVRSGGR